MRNLSAFTRIELLGLAGAVSVLGLLTLSAGSRTQNESELAACAVNVKQITTGFRSWAMDHQGKFPWDVVPGEGSRGLPNAWQHFAPLSTHVPNPRIFVCPSDNRNPATNYSRENGLALQTKRNNAISYWNGLHSRLDEPRSLLVGDRNIAGGWMEGCSTLGAGGGQAYALDRTAGQANRLRWAPGSSTDSTHDTGNGVMGFADGSVFITDDTQLNSAVVQQAETGDHVLLPQ